MKLLVGLGNIGPHFTGTRHNIGFEILDSFAAQNSLDWAQKDKFKAFVAEFSLNGEKVILAKPTTYYNVSGEAVRAIKDFYKLENADILIIHDELALPFATLRTREEGSDAGNNGIKSVLAHIGSDVARIRVGIANEHLQNYNAADFVLGKFSREEKSSLTDVFKHASKAILEFVNGDFTSTTLK